MRARALHVQGGSSRMYIGRRGVAWLDVAWRGAPLPPRQLSDSCTGLFTCARVYYNRAYDSNRSETKRTRRRYLHSRGRSMVDRRYFRRGVRPARARERSPSGDYPRRESRRASLFHYRHLAVATYFLRDGARDPIDDFFVILATL